MADEEKPKESDGGKWGIVFILVVLLVVGARMEGRGLLGEPIEKDVSEIKDTSGFSLSKLFGKGDLVLGENFINIKDTRVRNLPGGSILGVQRKFEVGKLMEGPVDQFGVFWWRVNYKTAPSGWVDGRDLSPKIGLIKTLNFFPIFLSGFKPFGYLLSFILLVILVTIKLLLKKEIKIEQKKRLVEDEQAARTMGRMTGAEAMSDGGGISGMPISGGIKIEQEPHIDFSIPAKNQKWEHVNKLMKSQNQNDWRQAVIEADIMLDEMLRKMSYDGKSIGDMLKQVERSDFATLDKAWEAHKFRNEIAHTGSDFAFSRDEADRVIRLFRDVFSEFYYI